MWASSYIRPLGQHSLFASQDASSINRLNVRVRVKVVYCTWKLTTIIMTVTPLIYWIICKNLCFHGVGNVCGHVTAVVQRWRIKQELKNHRKFFLLLQFFVSFLVFYKFCFVLFLNSAGETNVWPLIHFKALSLSLSLSRSLSLFLSLTLTHSFKSFIWILAYLTFTLYVTGVNTSSKVPRQHCTSVANVYAMMVAMNEQL